MKVVVALLAAYTAMCSAMAGPVAVKVDGARYFLDSADVKAIGSVTPDACVAVVPKLEVLWTDYTNRLEKLRLRAERAKAAKYSRGQNVNGRPPVTPMRFKAARKGGAK
jgi:hypothetical protein